MKINLVMIVKNEERCLGRCLESVKELADGIIIADTGSTDRTKEIALSYGAKVYDFKWIQDFSAARNYALEQSDGDWNLVLDADEYLREGTRKEIREFLEDGKHIGAVQIRSAHPVNGEISYSTTIIPRLLPRGGRFLGEIHEQVESKLPVVDIPWVFDHDGYLIESVKAERNLPYLLNMIGNEPTNGYFLYKAACSCHTLKKQKEALQYFDSFYIHTPFEANYRLQGVIFYINALMELELYEKALVIVQAEEFRFSEVSSFVFACGVFYMKLVLFNVQKYIAYLPRIEECYLRCLEIGEHPQEEGAEGVGSYKAAYNLGTWYEVSGHPEDAKRYYDMAAAQGYKPAQERLQKIKT